MADDEVKNEWSIDAVVARAESRHRDWAVPQAHRACVVWLRTFISTLADACVANKYHTRAVRAPGKLWISPAGLVSTLTREYCPSADLRATSYTTQLQWLEEVLAQHPTSLPTVRSSVPGSRNQRALAIAGNTAAQPDSDPFLTGYPGTLAEDELTRLVTGLQALVARYDVRLAQPVVYDTTHDALAWNGLRPIAAIVRRWREFKIKDEEHEEEWTQLKAWQGLEALHDCMGSVSGLCDPLTRLLYMWDLPLIVQPLVCTPWQLTALLPAFAGYPKVLWIHMDVTKLE